MWVRYIIILFLCGASARSFAQSDYQYFQMEATFLAGCPTLQHLEGYLDKKLREGPFFRNPNILDDWPRECLVMQSTPGYVIYATGQMLGYYSDTIVLIEITVTIDSQVHTLYSFDFIDEVL